MAQAGCQVCLFAVGLLQQCFLDTGKVQTVLQAQKGARQLVSREIRVAGEPAVWASSDAAAW